MTALVDLNHPSPLRYRVRRGRKERLGFESLTTTVSLREITSAEIPVVVKPLEHSGLGTKTLITFHGHEGGLWYRHGTLRDTIDYARMVHPGTEPNINNGFKHVFMARTPLVLAIEPAIPAVGLENRNGVGDIIYDGRERAIADLHRFVDDDLRLVGEDLYIRVPGPLFVLGGYPTEPVYKFDHRVREKAVTGEYASLGRIEDLMAFRARNPRDTHSEDPGVVPWKGSFLEMNSDDDLVIYANSHPQRLIGDATIAIQGLRSCGASTEGIEAIAAELYPYALTGMTGGNRLHDLTEIADLVCLLSDTLSQEMRTMSMDARHLDYGAAFARQFILPVMNPAIGPDDSMALEGIAP